MIHALHVETKLVSEELCALLRQVDPAVFVFHDEPEVRARVERVASRLRELVVAAERDDAGGRIERLRERLHSNENRSSPPSFTARGDSDTDAIATLGAVPKPSASSAPRSPFLNPMALRGSA